MGTSLGHIYRWLWNRIHSFSKYSWRANFVQAPRWCWGKRAGWCRNGPAPGPREPEFGRWGGKQTCPQMTNNQGCEFLRPSWRKAFLRAAQEERREAERGLKERRAHVLDTVWGIRPLGQVPPAPLSPTYVLPSPQRRSYKNRKYFCIFHHIRLYFNKKTENKHGIIFL